MKSFMKITTVMFDLDGTLLPMDLEKFVKTYFGLLAKKMAAFGYEPEKLLQAVGGGVKAMTTNTSGKTNEEIFWDYFTSIYGENVRKDIPLFEEFYKNEFKQAVAVCGFTPKSKEVIDLVKELGLRCICATNPVFPAIATETRMRFAGIEPEEFDYYTTYENSCFCKPNPAYYQEILQKIGCKPEECLMVGNDVTEDMAVETLGMKVFLLTDCLINKENKDIAQYPHGSFEELKEYIRECAAEA